MVDGIEIEPIDSEHDEGGVVHGLGESNYAPTVFEIEDRDGRYRVQEADDSGEFVTLATRECSCSLGGWCFHLRAADAYHRHRGGDGTE